MQAVGEPPLFLGSSIVFAIKDAIKAARKKNGYDPGDFRLDSPATSAKIRMACQDNITAKVFLSCYINHSVTISYIFFKFKEPEPGTFTPWNVLVE